MSNLAGVPEPSGDLYEIRKTSDSWNAPGLSLLYKLGIKFSLVR